MSKEMKEVNEQMKCCKRCEPLRDKLIQVYWGYTGICEVCGYSLEDDIISKAIKKEKKQKKETGILNIKPKKKFTTTIKAVYFLEKLKDFKKDGFFYEYKSLTDFWHTRLSNLDPPCDGVLLVGSKPYKITVLKVEIVSMKYIRPSYRGPLTTKYAWRLKCIFKTQ